MLSTVLANMRYRFILIGHHLHVQIQRQVLIVILLRFHRLYAGRAVLQRGQGGRIGVQADAAFRHLLAQRGQEAFGDILMYQQRFDRVTGARALHFGVNDHFQRFGNVSGVVDINMANADPAGDHRNRRLFAAQLMQTCAAARDQHIDILIHLQHLADQRPIRTLNRLDGGCR